MSFFSRTRAFAAAAFGLCLTLAAMCPCPSSGQENARANSGFTEIVEALNKGDRAKAVELADALRQKVGDDVDTLTRLAEVYLYVQDSERAAETLLAAARANPDDATIYTDLGIAYEQAGQIEMALEAHYTALSIDPAHPTVFNNIAKIYQGLGLDEAAGKAFRRAIINNLNKIAADRDFGDILSLKSKGGYRDYTSGKTTLLTYYFENLAIAYLGLGNRAKGIEMFKTAIKINPANAILRKNLEQVERMEDEESKKELSEAQKKERASQMEEQAQSALLRGDPNRAIAYLENALALGYETASAHTNMGIAYALREDYEEAIRQHERALELNPLHPTAYNNLGHAYEMLGRLEQARDAYQKAIHNNPNLSVAHENLANIYLQEQEYGPAIAQLKQALELDPKSVNALNNLAIAYFQVDQEDLAREALERGLEIEPKNETLLANLDVLEEGPGAAGAIAEAGDAEASEGTEGKGPAQEVITAAAPIPPEIQAPGAEGAGIPVPSEPPEEVQAGSVALADIVFPESEPERMAMSNARFAGQSSLGGASGRPPLSVAAYLQMQKMSLAEASQESEQVKAPVEDVEIDDKALFEALDEAGVELEKEPSETGMAEGGREQADDQALPKQDAAAPGNIEPAPETGTERAPEEIEGPASLPEETKTAEGSEMGQAKDALPRTDEPEENAAPREAKTENAGGEAPAETTDKTLTAVVLPSETQNEIPAPDEKAGVESAREETGEPQGSVEDPAKGKTGAAGPEPEKPAESAIDAAGNAPKEGEAAEPETQLYESGSVGRDMQIPPPAIDPILERYPDLGQGGGLPLPEGAGSDRFLSYSDGQERIFTDTYKYINELPGSFLLETADSTLWAYAPGDSEKGPRRLATGVQPGCQRNSERFAFLSLDKQGDVALNVANLAVGSRLTLYKDETLKLQPRLSADNRTAAFLKSGGGKGSQLVLFDMETKTAKPLESGLEIRSFDWSPAGAKLLISSGVCGKDGNGNTSCVGELDLGTGETSWLPENPADNGQGASRRILFRGDKVPSYSPDGKVAMIACKSGCEAVTLVDLEKREASILEPLDRRREPVKIEKPSWSPNGANIAFLNAGRLWVMDALTGGAVEVYVPDQGHSDYIRNFCWH